MGLIYDSGESSAVAGSLRANLASGRAVLVETAGAIATLVAAVEGGQLSGKAYSGVKTLFSEVIAPCVRGVESQFDLIESDLEKYVWADSKVSQYGVLNEDELEKQLRATRTQRKATERTMEANRDAANALAAIPTAGAAIIASNNRLELVANQLDIDIRTIEDMLKALREFAGQSGKLFVDSLKNVAGVTGDTVSLLNDIDAGTVKGFDFLGTGGDALGVARVYEYLAGRKLSIDSQGRIKLDKKFIYKPKTDYLHSAGKDLNAKAGVRIDHYKQPLKAGVSAALKSPVNDFTGWKDVSKIGKGAKFLGAAGTVLTVGANFDHYFHDGVQGNDYRDFGIDTAVDLGAAAAAAGVGAALGSLVLPPLGTVIGAGIGLFFNFLVTADGPDGDSLVDMAKKGAKSAWDWVAARFW